jgi:hypothetical protein
MVSWAPLLGTALAATTAYVSFIVDAHPCNVFAAGLRSLVSRRRFQAGFKLWLVCSVALAAAVGVAVGLPWLSPSVTMFGFLALVFTMRERVESSAEMVS